MFDISNKKILLTGGASGIGKSLAEGLSKADALVTCLDIKKPKNYKGVDHIKCDLNQISSIDLALKQYIKMNKCPDVLINCAGITIPSESNKYKQTDWDRTLNINLTSIFHICKRIGDKMIACEIQGSIINYTSIGAEQGFPNNPAYAASKGAVKQLSKALAVEWGHYGIRVNNIVPGYTATPMNVKSWNNKKLRKMRSDQTILKRWAQPEEMLGPTIFLASNASSYITGIDLIVDGGWLTKGI